MALAIVYSRASSGIHAPLVTVEVHLSNGLVAFNIVGLPEAAVKESRDRVKSALMNTQFDFPVRHITVNLAPADLPKEGGRFDLPIALGILAASGQLPAQLFAQWEFTGELALSGELRPVKGILPVVLSAHQSNRKLIVPLQNAEEAALQQQAEVFYAKHLLEVCAHIKGETVLPRCVLKPYSNVRPTLDLSDVKGQAQAKRALEIAAAGKHSLLYLGPPGTGKTMLASRLPGILPNLNEQEALEVAAIASVSSQGFAPEHWQHVPFRSPHHSSSSVALVGGGRPPKPGEISLAHHGILFMDELPEFNRTVLEALREPLESGCITISRAAYQMVFPARFQLIAAMNPCPCGYAGSLTRECQCSLDQIKRYLAKLSGPLMDRLDMQVEVMTVPPSLLTSNENTVEESSVIRQRVIETRERQYLRQGKYNSALTVSELNTYSAVSEEAFRLLNQVMKKFDLSARSYHRIIKVARTIADLDKGQEINSGHLSEALRYRCLDNLRKIIS